MAPWESSDMLYRMQLSQKRELDLKVPSESHGGFENDSEVTVHHNLNSYTTSAILQCAQAV